MLERQNSKRNSHLSGVEGPLSVLARPTQCNSGRPCDTGRATLLVLATMIGAVAVACPGDKSPLVEVVVSGNGNGTIELELTTKAGPVVVVECVVSAGAVIGHVIDDIWRDASDCRFEREYGRAIVLPSPGSRLGRLDMLVGDDAGKFEGTAKSCEGNTCKLAFKSRVFVVLQRDEGPLPHDYVFLEEYPTYPGLARGESARVAASIVAGSEDSTIAYCRFEGTPHSTNDAVSQEFSTELLRFDPPADVELDPVRGWPAVPTSDGNFECEGTVTLEVRPYFEPETLIEAVPFRVVSTRVTPEGDVIADDHAEIPVRGTTVPDIRVELTPASIVVGPDEDFSFRAQAFDKETGEAVSGLKYAWTFSPDVYGDLLYSGADCPDDFSRTEMFMGRCSGDLSDSHLQSNTRLLPQGPIVVSVFVKRPGADTTYASASGELMIDSENTGAGLCGNGIIDVYEFESCEDGNQINGDGCSAQCQLESCGDGILDPSEQCDDGNFEEGDGCSSVCTVCGDGVVDFNETCDDGNLIDGDGCQATCFLDLCGNGVVDAGEWCDDGNQVDDDACPNDCTFSEAEILDAHPTPYVNLSNGPPPRLTEDMAVEIFVEASKPIFEAQVFVEDCANAPVEDCAPQWFQPGTDAKTASIPMPAFRGLDEGGSLIRVRVAVIDVIGSRAEETIEFMVFPEDRRVGISCSRTVDPTGNVSIDFTLEDRELPDGSSVVGALNASMLLFQYDGQTGFAPDEFESQKFLSVLTSNTTTMTPGDDGLYQLVFTATILTSGESIPTQATLLFDSAAGDCP